MRKICMSGSRAGCGNGNNGRASEAPPDERGGNRYARPKATRVTLRLYHFRLYRPVSGAAGGISLVQAVPGRLRRLRIFLDSAIS
jgi:hypothetical protein